MLRDILGSVAAMVESRDTWLMFMVADKLQGESGKRCVMFTLELLVLFEAHVGIATQVVMIVTAC